MKSVDKPNPEEAQGATQVTALKVPSKTVTKRGGQAEEFSVDKLKKRIDQLTHGLETEYMGLDACVKKVIAYAHSGKSNRLLFIRPNSHPFSSCRNHHCRA
jgi:hypothetical protein